MKDVREIYATHIDPDVDWAGMQTGGSGECVRGKGEKYTGKTYPNWPHGPTVKEMKRILFNRIAGDASQRHRLKSEMDILSEGKKEEGDEKGWKAFTIIWIPPYCPQTQPIELLWAYVKNLVAKDWFEGRSLQDLLEQLFRAFYGGVRFPEEHWGENAKIYRGVNGELTNKLIEHCIKQCNLMIGRDELLGGTLDALTISEDGSQGPATLDHVILTPIQLQVAEVMEDNAAFVERDVVAML